MHAPGSAGVRRHAGAHNKGAGGSEGTRARVDMAAPVAISGDRSDSDVAGRAESTGVTMCISSYGTSLDRVFRANYFVDLIVAYHE